MRLPFDDFPMVHDWAAWGFVAVFGVLGIVVVFFRFVSAWGYGLVWILALLAATWTLRESTMALLLHPKREWWNVVLSVGWLSTVLCLTVPLWALVHRKHLRLKILLLAIPFLLPLGCRLLPWASSVFAESKGPSVVLVTADTLRADRCSVYGGDVQTPALEALAKRGVVFERHYSLAPWTVPSLAGLFAGKYPPGLTPGASDEQQEREEMSYYHLEPYWLGDDGQILVGRLREKGYETAAFVGNPAVYLERWLHDQFDHFVIVDSLFADLPRCMRQLPTMRRFLSLWKPSLLDTNKVDSTWVLTRCAIEYLRQHRGNSLFLWVHFMDPHTPYNPPERFRDASVPWTAFPEWMTQPGFTRKDHPSAGALTEQDREYARQLYDGEVRYVDEAFGEIMGTFDRLGMGANSYLVFSSDHGEELWDRGRNGHGYTLYEEQLHVPLLISGPNLDPQIVKEPVSGIDLMPTLAQFLGVEASPDCAGTSLAPALQGEAPLPAARPIFALATHFYLYHPEPQQAVLMGDQKLIQGLESNRFELYDLGEDRGEGENLADARQRAVEKLTKELDAWGGTFPTSFDEFWKTSSESPPEERHEGVEEVLRALGYLGD
jgi:arylsulfatase A-like enzyme